MLVNQHNTLQQQTDLASDLQIQKF